MKNRICAIVVLIFPFILNGQYTFITGGGNASELSGSVSFSIGQMTYTSFNDSNGTLHQGVQQPYELLILLDLDQNDFFSREYIVYPNPSIDIVHLKIEDWYKLDLHYLLLDDSGKMINFQKIETEDTSISVKNLASTTYLLKILEKDQEIKSYKIVKN